MSLFILQYSIIFQLNLRCNNSEKSYDDEPYQLNEQQGRVQLLQNTNLLVLHDFKSILMCVTCSKSLEPKHFTLCFGQKIMDGKSASFGIINKSNLHSNTAENNTCIKKKTI